jgi:hypothetical protein
MAKRMTPTITGSGVRSTKGRGEQETGTAVQEAPQAARGAATGQRAGPKPEQIAQRAHEIWIRHGCPLGEDKENWFEAEVELRREMGL